MFNFTAKIKFMKKLILIIVIALSACKKEKTNFPSCQLNSNSVFVYNDLEFTYGKWYDTINGSKTIPLYEFMRDYCIYKGQLKLYYIGVNKDKTVKYNHDTNYGSFNFRYENCQSVDPYILIDYKYDNGIIMNKLNNINLVKL